MPSLSPHWHLCHLCSIILHLILLHFIQYLDTISSSIMCRICLKNKTLYSPHFRQPKATDAKSRRLVTFSYRPRHLRPHLKIASIYNSRYHDSSKTLMKEITKNKLQFTLLTPFACIPERLDFLPFRFSNTNHVLPHFPPISRSMRNLQVSPATPELTQQTATKIRGRSEK